jgi:hypothetical protein
MHMTHRDRWFALRHLVMDLNVGFTLKEPPVTIRFGMSRCFKSSSARDRTPPQ